MMDNKIEAYYTDGVSSVEHRNINASGDGHPFGDEPKEWEADLRPLIRDVADNLYETWEATVREYLANAETACLKVESFVENPEESPYDEMIVSDDYEGRITVVWDRSKRKLIIQDNGIGMAGVEVDQVFRHIGRSAARDLGSMSGSFGMGALSFLKFIGSNNSTMVTLSHSRLNDDNAAYLVSLAGVEPVRGSLGEDEYGTKFKLDQKKKDMEIRQSVSRFAEWMRVPVLYRELDENGTEVFNEDYGDKRLYDQYDPDANGQYFIKDGFFEAYSSPDATGKTLLLSMDIDRNDDNRHDATYPFDVRLLDESGKVVESSNGNEGLIPVPRVEYEQMLVTARDDYITENLLSNQDVVAYRTNGDVYDYAIEESILESEEALPIADYVPLSQGDDELIGTKVVLVGPHSGREVVSEDRWDDLSEGRASMFVPEDELEEFDISSQTGDLCLPKPTTDRSSLQKNETFWKYIGNYFAKEYDRKIEEYRTMLEQSDDTYKAIQEMNANTVAEMREELEYAR